MTQPGRARAQGMAGESRVVSMVLGRAHSGPARCPTSPARRERWPSMRGRVTPSVGIAGIESADTTSRLPLRLRSVSVACSTGGFRAMDADNNVLPRRASSASGKAVWRLARGAEQPRRRPPRGKHSRRSACRPSHWLSDMTGDSTPSVPESPTSLVIPSSGCHLWTSHSCSSSS